MAKVTNKELNECIAEAIAEVIKEDWADDVVLNAMSDTSAKNAFLRDKKKDDKIEMADDEKVASSEVADLPDADDEETVSFGKDFNVYDMSYDELKNAVKNSNPGTNLRTAATKELKLRNEILRDKKDILNGELIMPYGWAFDENGYPVRKHSFMQESTLSESWEDDIVNTAMNDKKAMRAFGLKPKKGKNGGDEQVSDEDILDLAASKEENDPDNKKLAAADRKEEEEMRKLSGEEGETQDNETDDDSEVRISDIKTMSYWDIFNLEKRLKAEGKKNSQLCRAAVKELCDRNTLMCGQDVMPKKGETEENYIARINKIAAQYRADVENGEVGLDYGWKIGDDGYPERTHIFQHPDIYADRVDMANSNGTNFHWLRPNMNVYGQEIGDRVGQGIPDANWS